jgi:hypothetical protein
VGYPNLSKTKEAISYSSKQTREFTSNSCKVEITERGGRISVHIRITGRLTK